jgi:hypothetical protein
MHLPAWHWPNTWQRGHDGCPCEIRQSANPAVAPVCRLSIKTLLNASNIAYGDSGTKYYLLVSVHADCCITTVFTQSNHQQ